MALKSPRGVSAEGERGPLRGKASTGGKAVFPDYRNPALNILGYQRSVDS
jgi:hypothetical protein